MVPPVVPASLAILCLLVGCLPDYDERVKDSGVRSDTDGSDNGHSEDDSPASDPIAVLSISPESGTNAGGTLLLIRGGPFDSSADITFGGVSGTVANVASENELRVLTPATVETGFVDVEITTSTGRGTREAGFQYFTDGTGKLGSVGVFYWQHFLGDYWTNAVDQGFAWWALVDPPESRSIPEIYYSPAVDTCVSNYTITGFTVDDVGVSNTTLRVTNRAVQLAWDSSQYIWSKELEEGDFVQNVAYSLDEVPAVTASVENFARTPTTFLLGNPNLNTLGYLGQSDLTFQWSQATADEILLHLVRWEETSTSTVAAEEVSCRISNPNTSGQFTVPPSVWTGWGGSYMEIRVGAIAYAAGTLPFNNSRSGVIGGYWVIGASLMQ